MTESDKIIFIDTVHQAQQIAWEHSFIFRQELNENWLISLAIYQVSKKQDEYV